MSDKRKDRGARSAEKKPDHRDLYGGLIRLHVLHHAVKEPVYGFAMIEELRRHGYELSTGTLYPILHGLERDGLLSSTTRLALGKLRRYYRTTVNGRKTLKEAMGKVEELMEEVRNG